MATTFYPFPRLPYELRTHIWSMTASRRTVHVHVNSDYTCTPGKWFRAEGFKVEGWFGAEDCSLFSSPDPPPAVMHACHEARRHAPFRKAFLSTCTKPGMDRYLWINFDEDVIFLEKDPRNLNWVYLSRLKPHHAEIQRLRFTLPDFDEGAVTLLGLILDSNEKGGLKRFVALRELQMDARDSFADWCGFFADITCPVGNARLSDCKTGLQLLTGPQISMTSRWQSYRGGKVNDMATFDDELADVIKGRFSLFNLSEFAEIG